MMLTNVGWKIVEVGPRVGGFRHELYSAAYNINHAINDLLVRGGKKPVIPKKLVAYSAYYKIYGRTEGHITDITGLHMLQELPSLVSMVRDLYTGEATRFAKNGGAPLFHLFFMNKDMQAMNHDINRMEHELKVTIAK